jgi:hypothetical protein
LLKISISFYCSLIFIFFIECEVFAQVKNDIILLTFDEQTQLHQLFLYDYSGDLISDQTLPITNIKNSATGDFDGDGIDELLICSKGDDGYYIFTYRFNSVTWILYNSIGLNNIKPDVLTITGVAGGDINGDGICDLVLIVNNNLNNILYNRIIVLKSNGDNFESYIEFTKWDFSFNGLCTGDFNGDGKDEIAVFRVDGQFNNLLKNRLLIFSVFNNQNYLIFNNNYMGDNFDYISSADFNADGLLDLVFSTDHNELGKGLLFLTSSKSGFNLFSRKNLNSNELKGIICRDFNGDFLDDLLAFELNTVGVIQYHYYKSNIDEINFINSGELSAFTLLSTMGGNFRSRYPHTYLDSIKIEYIKMKGNERGASNYIEFHIVNYSNNYNFSNVETVFHPIYNRNEFNDLHRQNYSDALKKIGIGVQLRREQITKLEQAKSAFIIIANYFSAQYNYIKSHTDEFSESTGILSSQILYDATILTDLAWAYDLLFNEFSPSERKIIRTKLFVPAIEWQLRYCSGKGNHQDWQNLAIGHVGFAINWRRFIAAALPGTNISNVAAGYLSLPQGFWQGLSEQLSNPAGNTDIIPSDFGYWGNTNQFNNGAYFSDFIDDEGSVFYTHFSLLSMIRLAMIAYNNNYYINYFEFPDGKGVLDQMSRSLASLVYPDLKDYPDINNEILDEAPAQIFEMLESVLYSNPPKLSPYTKLLQLFRGSYNGTVVDIDEDLYFFNGFGTEDLSCYENSIVFDKAGWGLLRSTNSITDSNKLYILFDFGPYGINNHGHADRLNLILYSNKYGELLKDVAKIRNTSSSYWGYSSKIQHGWVESTLSHNTILINGQRQADPDYSNSKPHVQDNLYGLTTGEEHSFANRISIDSDYSINNDSLQFVSAKVPFSSAYGDNYEVERIITLLNNRFIVDEINIERRNFAPIDFIDLVYHGPTLKLNTDPITDMQIDIAENQINRSYNYFYDVNQSGEFSNKFWNATWSDSQDDHLKIYGFRVKNQVIISAKSPDDLNFNGMNEKVNPNAKRSSLIIRSKGFIAGTSEFINIIDPTFSVADIEYNDEKETINIYDKNGKSFIYRIKFGLSKKRNYEYYRLEDWNLYQNYPNPFNNQTTILYSVINSSNVSINIYNWLGERITEIPQGWRTPGIYEVNVNMNSYASGVYFYSINAAPYQKTKKMILLK